MKLLTDLFTEPDNQTWCPTRTATGLAFAIYHGVAAAGFWVGQLHLDIDAMGHYVTHMTMLIGFGSTAVTAKSAFRADTPTPPQPAATTGAPT